jgi:class 3 adenylate cyclase
VQAVDLHDKVLRQYLADFAGYEVTTEGDAFLVAFHHPAEAVGYCLTVQLALQGEARSAQSGCAYKTSALYAAGQKCIQVADV